MAESTRFELVVRAVSYTHLDVYKRQLLDSDLFDVYFRTFNGNVNVSATELRSMPLPDLGIIKSIGEKLILKNNFSVENVNEIVNNYFQIS